MELPVDSHFAGERRCRRQLGGRLERDRGRVAGSAAERSRPRAAGTGRSPTGLLSELRHSSSNQIMFRWVQPERRLVVLSLRAALPTEEELRARHRRQPSCDERAGLPSSGLGYRGVRRIRAGSSACRRLGLAGRLPGRSATDDRRLEQPERRLAAPALVSWLALVRARVVRLRVLPPLFRRPGSRGSGTRTSPSLSSRARSPSSQTRTTCSISSGSGACTRRRDDHAARADDDPLAAESLVASVAIEDSTGLRKVISYGAPALACAVEQLGVDVHVARSESVLRRRRLDVLLHPGAA